MSDADIWKVLGDPARRRILDLLRDGPKTTGQIAEIFERTRFSAMNHLEILKSANLVTVEKRGRERWHHLNAAPLMSLVRQWVEPFGAAWAGRLQTIKAIAQRGEKEQDMVDVLKGGRVIQIRQEITIAAAREKVFRALTTQLGEWWGAPQLVRNDAIGVTLEPRLGGIMGETWPEGGGQAWCMVEAIEPPRLLQLTGRMMMPGCIAGWIKYELNSEGNGTRLSVDHKAVGDISPEIEEGFGEGWHDLNGRLKAFAEKGTRSGINAR